MTDSSTSPSPANSAPAGKRAWPLVLAWTFCAMLALACGWLWQLHLAALAQIAVLRDQQQLAEIEARSARQHAEAQHLIDRRLLEDAHRELDELKRGAAKSIEK